MSIHITFEHVQSHKWNRHYWTKTCVLGVSIKYGIIHRPWWSFIDQFNQVKSYATGAKSSDLSLLQKRAYMTSHKRMRTFLRSFSFGFCTIQYIWSLFRHHISFWNWILKFLIFQHWELAFGFLSTLQFNLKGRFPFFLVKY